MKDYEIFTSRFVPPLVYREILDRQLGKEWRDWEPETLVEEILRHWNVRPSDEVMEKIMALQTVISTDLLWDEFLAFEKIILAFNDRHVDMTIVQKCNPEELAYGMTVALQVSEPKPFSNDVIEYIRACHREAGQLVYHPIVKSVQPDYPDDFRKEIVKGVLSKAARDGDTAEVKEDDPVSVQFAKVRDCAVYVEERLGKAGIRS